MSKVIPIETVEQKIFLIRGQKVMLSHHLSSLYGVETKTLIQAVKRNIERFPDDFVFRLAPEEVDSLRSQIVTLKNVSKRGRHIKYLPYAFTEQGIAMLSSVLRSKQAIQVNISIMRTFVKLRKIISSHKELADKFKELEHKVQTHDKDILLIFQAINKLMAPPPEPPKRRIGFHS